MKCRWISLSNGAVSQTLICTQSVEKHFYKQGYLFTGMVLMRDRQRIFNIYAGLFKMILRNFANKRFELWEKK